jgi:hypothetical protein
MELEDNTEAIIRLAWARLLSLEDTALEQGGEVIRAELDDVLMYVRLFDAAVLAGPAELTASILDRTDPTDLDRLTNGRELMTRLDADRQRSARLAGSVELAYTDSYADEPDLDDWLITDDRAATVQVERLSPPDDIVETRLDDLPHHYVLCDRSEQPIAVAGAGDWQQVISTLTVLVGLPYRRQGHGRRIAAAAGNDLIDSGLIPEFRTSPDHPAARALARRLGYRPVGSATRVSIE